MKKFFLALLFVVFSGAVLASNICPYKYYDRHGKADSELKSICSDFLSYLGESMHTYCTSNQVGTGKGSNGCVDQQLVETEIKAASPGGGVGPASQANLPHFGVGAQNSSGSSSSSSNSGNIFQ